MAQIAVLERKCTGCGLCSESCPFGAIDMKDGKPELNAACRVCGICVKTCPEKAMIRLETRVASVDKSQWKDILVFAEVADGRLHPVSLELIGKARELAQGAPGFQVKAVLLGNGVMKLARELQHYGVSEVVAYDDPALSFFRADVFATCIEDYIRVVKMDYPWTVPDGYAARQDVVTEDKWLPDATKYPNGHNLWSAIRAHSPNMRFALYMADTYQGVDIGTEYGRNLQIQALKERFRPTNNDYGLGFDYWRSDFNVEASHDYDSHEGLLEILDTMIDYSSDFRYEHCMGGGTLKEFTTLERMTFMTTEDTALPLNHRMSLYANSYMIHPVQLKADLNMTYTSRDYGALTGYGNILTSGQQCWTSEEYSKYALRTGMMGASMLAFPHQALVQHNAMIETHHDLYNQVQRPILRDCNVYHILPSPTGWTYADWDGIQYYNENIDKGVVMLFKENTTAPNSKTIVLKGLDANTSYTLTFIDRTAQNCVKTGAELMSTGINVTGMTEQYDSELIYIEPVQQS